MFTQVAQKLQGGQLTGPFKIVRDDRSGWRVVEFDESLQLPTYPVGPFCDDVCSVQVSFGGVAGVPDEAGGSPGQHDGPVAGPLESTQGEQRHQVPGVQTRGSGVKPSIHTDRALGDIDRERVAVGRLRDEAAPRQLVKDG
ncbi:Uncharacterised protein [Mycobacteroides abscessus subsp. abscessus]|nr:Uncharacterised protein [Mycobacteroides abscessus subsp. abscessus]